MTPKPNETIQAIAEQLVSIAKNYRENGGYAMGLLETGVKNTSLTDWLMVPLHISELDLLIDELAPRSTETNSADETTMQPAT